MRAPRQGPIVRVTVANVAPLVVAQRGQAAGLSGTVAESIGFGSWGIEPGATVEFGGQDLPAVHAFVQGLLAERGESAAYVTHSGAPWLWHVDGRVESLAPGSGGMERVA